jgi:hypothetical protein
MKYAALRELIREEVRRLALHEAKKAEAPPSTFASFRKRVAAGLKKANAPAALVDEADDINDEGGGVVAALWDAWRDIEVELKDAGADKAEVWRDCIEMYIHDAVINMADEFRNPMNHALGSKKGAKPIDSAALAKAVVVAMLPVTKKLTADEIRARELSDMLGLVTDILENVEGAVANIDWKGGRPTVTYDVLRSDYLDFIHKTVTTETSLKPVDGEDDTYFDKFTGLMVHFGDGVATIK